MKKIILASTLLILMLSGCANKSSVSNQPVAKVNGAVITQQSLDTRYELLAHSMALNPDTLATLGGHQGVLSLTDIFKQLALDGLTDELLIQQYAEAHHITVSEAEIDARYNAEKSLSVPFMNTTDFKQKLEKLGYTPETFKNQLRNLLLKEKVANQITGKALKPSNSDILKYYQSHHGFYDTPNKVHVKHILIAANLEDTEKAYRREHPTASETNVLIGVNDALSAQRIQANTVLKEVITHQNNFSDYAKKYSSDSFSANDGGDLGYISYDMMPPTFSKAAFSMPENVVYPYVVQTRFGFHIIQVLDKKSGQKANLSKINALISQKLYEDRVDQVMNKWLAKRRAQSQITYAEGYRFESELHQFQSAIENTARQKEASLKKEIQAQPLLLPTDED